MNEYQRGYQAAIADIERKVHTLANVRQVIEYLSTLNETNNET